MKLIVPICLVLFIFCTFCPSFSTCSVERTRRSLGRLVGGLTEERKANEEVQNLAQKVKPNLESKLGTTFNMFDAITYKTQLVAGTNYFIKVQVDNNQFIFLRVFKPLPHTHEDPVLSTYRFPKTSDEEIMYFS